MMQFSLTESWNKGATVCASVALLGLFSALLLFALGWGIEPLYVLVIATCVPIAALVMEKWPIVLLAGLLYVGEFKTVPAQGIELTDPTMVALLLLCCAIALRIVLLFTRRSSWTIARLFTGQTAVITLFVLFSAVLALGLLYTESREAGVKVARFETFEILMFLAPLLLIKDKRDLRQLLALCTVLSIILSIQVFIGLLHPSELVLSGNEDISKIGVSELIGFALLFCLYAKPLGSGLLGYACIVTLICGLVACVTRTALIATLATLVISAFVIRSRNSFSRKRILLGMAIAFAVAVPTLFWLMKVPAAQNKLRWKIGELSSLASGATVSTGTITSRLDFYRSALDAFEQHPILGLGVGGWSISYYNQDVLHYPHNFLLEVGAEQGLAGLIPLIALLVLLFRSSLRALRADGELSFTFPTLVFCIAYNLMTGNVESRQFWFVCGLTAAAARISLLTVLTRHERESTSVAELTLMPSVF